MLATRICAYYRGWNSGQKREEEEEQYSQNKAEMVERKTVEMERTNEQRYLARTIVTSEDSGFSGTMTWVRKSNI